MKQSLFGGATSMYNSQDSKASDTIEEDNREVDSHHEDGLDSKQQFAVLVTSSADAHSKIETQEQNGTNNKGNLHIFDVVDHRNFVLRQQFEPIFFEKC
jgi:hypothetical protein